MIHEPVHCLGAARRSLVAAFAATCLLAACGSNQQSIDTTASPAAASIDVSSVWARTSPMVAEAGAVYLVIDNSGGLDDVLIAAHVDASIAKTAELHETAAVDASTTTVSGGMTTSATAAAAMPSGTMPAAAETMMEMRPVDRIVVPAQGSVALAPGGYHIMMKGLVEPLTVGSVLNLTLTFEVSGDQVVIATVRDTAP
jgi:copper(I)-binding protein